MPELDLDALRAAIARLRASHAAAMAAERAQDAPATWEVSSACLCWYVVLHRVPEPDIDVEVLPDALVVRAAGRRVRRSILPVPEPFAPRRAEIRFEAGVLEIRVREA